MDTCPSTEEIDAEYGLEPAVPFGRADYVGSAIVASALVPSGGHRFFDEVIAANPFPWRTGSGQQEQARARVATLLARVHVEDAEVLRLHLQGLPSTKIGERVGLSQPAAWARIEQARRRLQLASYLPDLPPEQIARDVVQVWPRRRAGQHPPDLVGRWAAAYYWIPGAWTVARCMGLPQATGQRWQRRLGEWLPKGHPWHRITEWPMPPRGRGTQYRGPVGGTGWQVARGIGLIP